MRWYLHHCIIYTYSNGFWIIDLSGADTSAIAGTIYSGTWYHYAICHIQMVHNQTGYVHAIDFSLHDYMIYGTCGARTIPGYRIPARLGVTKTILPWPHFPIFQNYRNASYLCIITFSFHRGHRRLDTTTLAQYACHRNDLTSNKKFPKDEIMNELQLPSTLEICYKGQRRRRKSADGNTSFMSRFRDRKYVFAMPYIVWYNEIYPRRRTQI